MITIISISLLLYHITDKSLLNLHQERKPEDIGKMLWKMVGGRPPYNEKLIGGTLEPSSLGYKFEWS